jgi:DNA-directed RNA polymerase subunit RPC12/RpoP
VGCGRSAGRFRSAVLHASCLESDMPIYEYVCNRCGRSMEVMGRPMAPDCCGGVMKRCYGRVLVKVKYPMWIDRIDEIHKAQEQKGERFRFVHPSEVL